MAASQLNPTEASKGDGFTVVFEHNRRGLITL
jgi:hypothetical protein